MLRQLLRSQTAEGHRRLEEELNLVRPDLTKETYVALLERFWGFYEPLERRLVPALEASWPGVFLCRAKTPLLKRDLSCLKQHSDASLALLPRAADLPHVATRDQALGVAYVLEGATLGGKFLTVHFAKLLGLDADNGGSFFRSYGDAVDTMWQQFCTLINEYDARGANHAEVVDAAQATFASMHAWLCDEGRVLHGAG